MELNQTTFNEVPGGRVEVPGENHLACALLLDTSSSMGGAPIDSLNQAIRDFKEQTSMDEQTRRRVDVAIVEFNDGARVVQDFTPICEMKPITLSATGCTDMGAGINLAIDIVKERNRTYATLGTPCFQPWIVMITDGNPTDDISAAVQRIKEEESKGAHGKLKFWAIGAPGYNKEIFKNFDHRRCFALKEKNFENFFNWLSESVTTVSVSQPGIQPSLPGTPQDMERITDW